MSTKTMKEKAAELLQKCEIVVLSSVNKEGYPRPVPMSKIAAEGISAIWMSTGANSLKTIDFLSNPKAGLCFQENRCRARRPRPQCSRLSYGSSSYALIL